VNDGSGGEEVERRRRGLGRWLEVINRGRGLGKKTVLDGVCGSG
jgi:hypothetical protein